MPASAFPKPTYAINLKIATPASPPSPFHESGSNNEHSGEEWTLVSSKAKTPAAAWGTLQSPSAGRVDDLAANRFFLPAGLESKLHAYPRPASSGDSSDEVSMKKGLRCHKRNQRHARKRAQQRLALQSCSETTTGESGADNLVQGSESEELDAQLHLPDTPNDVSSKIFSFLDLDDLVNVGSCSKWCSEASQDPYLWQNIYRSKFPSGRLCGAEGISEWKLACQLEHTGLIGRLRCSYTKETFFEDVIGVGVDFSVNPKTKRVDYVSLSQDLLGHKSFSANKVRQDVFGASFKLFLPLYFSSNHFSRGLPKITRSIVRLCPEKKTSRFDPFMVLDVLPKIMCTFVVLLSDEGLSASRKSFYGLLRIHRLFLAMAHEYPQIKQEALTRLRRFVLKEQNRTKTACPSLGDILPLMMIVDEKDFSWRDMCLPYLLELFDRAVLWTCKAHPKLEITCGPNGKPESRANAEERIFLSREAMAVGMRLVCFHVYFLRACCRGTTSDRAKAYDIFFGRPDPEDPLVLEKDVSASESNDAASAHHVTTEPTTYRGLTLSFPQFNEHVAKILNHDTWQQFFKLVSARCPPSKAAMAQLLRQAVRNSRRKGYHKAGMDFARIHASGSSKILSKGQTCSTSSGLRRVTFHNDWTFEGQSKFLDASCLLYRGRHLVNTIDYQNTNMDNGSRIGAVVHSGDVMRGGGGTHTIQIDLEALPSDTTSLVFVISAWAEATLSDIVLYTTK